MRRFLVERLPQDEAQGADRVVAVGHVFDERDAREDERSEPRARDAGADGSRLGDHSRNVPSIVAP